MPFVNTGFSEFLEDNVKEITDQYDWMKDREFKLCGSIEELKEFIDRAIEKNLCALDIEATGLSTRTFLKNGKNVSASTIVGFCLSYDSKFGLYVPINHQEDSEYNLPERTTLDEIERLTVNCVCIFHNAKYDLALLKNYGIIINDFRMFEDTLILGKLYDAGSKENGLKKLSEKLLDQPMLEYKEVAVSVDRFDLVSPKIGYIYGGSDAVCTLDLFEYLINLDIVKEQRLIYNLEKRVVFVVMEMESHLIRVDVAYFKGIKDRANEAIEKLLKEIYSLAKREFNVGSPKQLGPLLFEELGYEYPQKKKTASGQYMTDDKTLKKIADKYPLVQKIIEIRSLNKLSGTYVRKLIANTDENGFIKLGFNQTGTDTGRFSSPGGKGLEIDGYSGVNFQSMPKKPDEKYPELDLRKSLIVRDPNKTMVAIDYVNEEMRVATNLSDEDVWIRALEDGIDFHTATGALVASKRPEDVEPKERKIGKTVNFLSLYLGGYFTLSEQAKISIPEAKRILTTFFAGVPKLKRWMDREINRCRKLKKVRTVFGRVRPLDRFYDSGDKISMSHGDRCIVNTEIQGTCADIMKIVMAKLRAWIYRNNLQDDIKILITMHDELVFEITTSKLDFLVPEICKIMMLKEIIIDQLKWKVPLTVDVQYGPNWRVENNFFKDFPKLKEKLSEPIYELKPLNPHIKSSNPETESTETESTENPETESIETESTETESTETESTETESTETESTETESKENSETESTENPETESTENSETESTENSGTKSTENPETESTENPETESTENPETERIGQLSIKSLIYTIKERDDKTLRWINDIISFLLNEPADKIYECERKILRLRDKDGNSLLVSEFEVPVDAFLSLARFFGI